MPLAARFSPSTSDVRLLATNPPLRILFADALTSPLIVIVLIPIDWLTRKSPRLLLELSRTLNLLPATKPCATEQVSVVIPTVAL